jgi:hypothetical protein
MTTDRYVYPREGTPTIIVDRPTLTERTAHILGQYFRQDRSRAPVGTPRVSPREIPRPFPDTRPVAPAQTTPTSNYVEIQKTLRRRNFMADHGHGGGSGGGSGASFANFAIGAAFTVLGIILFIGLLNMMFGRTVTVTYVPPSTTVTTTAPARVCTPEFTTSVGGTSYFRIPDGC